MADDARKSFPMMATPHWWSLRKKFRSAIPREVTPNYLAAALGMNENSAKTNVMPTLRQTGIVDKDNKPTDLAVRWRDDANYADVCQEIRAAVYPQELRDLAPDTSTPRESIRSWFANHTGMGESGAQKMTAFYWTLLEADPTKQVDAPAREVSRPTPRVNAKASKAPSIEQVAVAQRAVAAIPPAAQHVSHATRNHPEIHINVQIHISAESTSDQIEQIFSSMSKHLKDFA